MSKVIGSVGALASVATMLHLFLFLSPWRNNNNNNNNSNSNSGASETSLSLLFDALLFALFAAQHSFTRPLLEHISIRFNWSAADVRVHRALYSLCSCASLELLFCFWRQTDRFGGALSSSAVQMAVNVLYALAWALLVAQVVCSGDLTELLGVQQVFSSAVRAAQRHPDTAHLAWREHSRHSQLVAPVLICTLAVVGEFSADRLLFVGATVLYLGAAHQLNDADVCYVQKLCTNLVRHWKRPKSTP
jgi:hypothetical protein